jgi:phosphopantothenoylcysteine decarboxylase
MANGISDNLLTNCALAWHYYDKPFYFAPSMNVKMLSHPATIKNTETLKSFGAICIEPQEKKLFCGDIGNGAMADISEICKLFR